MKKNLFLVSVFLLVSALWAAPARAHFGMIIPSAPAVMDPARAGLTLTLRFWHPFENVGLNLERPKSFRVWKDGKPADLGAGLTETGERGFTTWTAGYAVKRPGLYTFTMEPAPYWEPAEDRFIVHFTKVQVEAFGDDAGWDEPLGLTAEIVALSKPTSLYAGNVFQGRVLFDGRPASGAEVEIEWYPGPELKGRAPYESMVTQTVKADEAGVFAYAAPRAGWWGFAALRTADYKLKADGRDRDVELGAVLWVYFHDMLPAEPLESSR
jgi:cobalt/nickel transport protein